MIAQVLRRLLDGKYLCPVAFRAEYDQLCDENVQQEVDTWLGKIDMRLARLGEDGAFFMAPRKMGMTEAGRIRDDFAKFRDVYGPAVLMLNLIRQAKDAFMCRMGDSIQLAELMAALGESATLETQLRSMHGVVSGSAMRQNNREFLKRLLEHLRGDGYLVVANEQTETYEVTGKIDQLSAALQFIAEQEAIVGDDAEDRLDDAEGHDLFNSKAPGAEVVDDE